MEFILTIVYLLIFLKIINSWKFFKNKWVSKKKIKAFFIIKIIVGLFLFWVYSNHYSKDKLTRQDADIFKYFDDSEYIFNSIYDKPLDFTKILQKPSEIDDKYKLKGDILNVLEAWDEMIKVFEKIFKISLKL